MHRLPPAETAAWKCPECQKKWRQTGPRARLAFAFDILVLEGREYSIGTGPLDITAGSTRKKDAATIGIGAGAVVGAILDGERGAGIGAMIGWATGTGVILANTGREVELGSGARLTVRLTRGTRL